ncbi:MAG TPA: FAD-dependent oxidoreductase, partial [Lachnospiraceae bacterium]|nr:FAD-dependent oxidoreductase [Lachnospiraceae bacterium]
MIQIAQIKCRPDEGMEALRAKVCRILHLRREDDFSMQIRRKSVDARKKPDIFYVFTVDVMLNDPGREQKILGRNRDRNVIRAQEVRYALPSAGTGHIRKAESGSGDTLCGQMETLRPVIVGTGPAGLFCGLSLARAGLRPILIERGQSVLQRTETVARFWEGGRLNPESNVQFGEGGAGTFSDGKLNTGVKDAFGRIRFVLETFVAAGADPEILYSYKPHIGTDVLREAVAHIRDEIIARGGEVRFS